MKGRKRKRGSKAASKAKVPVDAEKGASRPSTALPDTDRKTYPRDGVIASIDVKEPDSDPTAPTGEDYVIDLGSELLAAVEEKPASDSVTLAQAGRHSHPGKELPAAAVDKEKPVRPSRLRGQTAGLILATSSLPLVR
jgi:hypothetical protein